MVESLVNIILVSGTIIFLYTHPKTRMSVDILQQLLIFHRHWTVDAINYYHYLFYYVVRYYMFGRDEETGTENENWSSLSAGMLTLFTYVTVRYSSDTSASIATKYTLEKFISSGGGGGVLNPIMA